MDGREHCPFPALAKNYQAGGFRDSLPPPKSCLLLCFHALRLQRRHTCACSLELQQPLKQTIRSVPVFPVRRPWKPVLRPPLPLLAHVPPNHPPLPVSLLIITPTRGQGSGAKRLNSNQPFCHLLPESRREEMRDSRPQVQSVGRNEAW